MTLSSETNKQTNKCLLSKQLLKLCLHCLNCILFKGNKQGWSLLQSASVFKTPIAGSCGGEGSRENSVNGLDSRTGGNAVSELLASRRPCKPHVAVTS